MPNPRVRRAVLLTASVAACLATALPAAAQTPAFRVPVGTSTNKVLVVGTDGTRWDKLYALMASGRAPAFSRLAAEGAATPTTLGYTPPFAFTVSQVGWTTIASGVWPPKHGVTDPSNESPGQRTKNGYPDFLARVERFRPSLSTMLVTDWANLGLERNGGPIFSTADAKRTVDSGDAAAYDANDEASSIAAADALRGPGPDASFVYFGVVDETGHEEGSESEAYRNAIIRTDHRLGRLLDAIDARPTLAREHWTVLVTTDHGQFDPLPGVGFHGGPTELERTSFIFARGPGVPRHLDRGNAAMVDIAPTLLHQLRLPIAYPEDLDGNSLVTDPPPPAPGPPTAVCRRSADGVRCTVSQGAAAPPLRRARISAAARSRTISRTAPAGHGALRVDLPLARASQPSKVRLLVTDIATHATLLTVRLRRG